MFPLRLIRFTGAGALPVPIECMRVCTQAHVQISVCTYVSVSL